MKADPQVDELEPVWKALANPTRRKILDVLFEGPETTGELATHFPELTRFAVMQHLRVLEESDLVVLRRRGRERWNFINPVPIQKIYARWVSRYQQPWVESLVALQGSFDAGEAKAVDHKPGGRS